MSPPTVYGAMVRELRLKRNWTLKGLAFYLGVSVDHLTDIEHGRASPSEELEEKIKQWRDSGLAESPEIEPDAS